MSTELTVYFIATSTVCPNKMLPIKFQQPQSPIPKQKNGIPTFDQQQQQQQKKTTEREKEKQQVQSERIKSSQVSRTLIML